MRLLKVGPEVVKRMKHIPQGGYYENLPEKLKVKKCGTENW